jgi:hypothetical protein
MRHFALITCESSLHTIICQIEKDHLKEGIWLGVVWLGLNWLLDLVCLLPLSKMPYLQYFKEIGLRYLVMPAMTIPVGYVLSKKLKT